MMSLSNCPNCGKTVKSDDFFCPSCGAEMITKPQTKELKSSTSIQDYRRYIPVIGAVEVGLGMIAMFFAIILAFFGLSLPILINSDIMDSDLANSDINVGIFVGIIIILFALGVLIFAISAIIYGRRIMHYKESGRTGTMIISVISLIFMPFGTVFGIAALYILTRPEIESFLT